MRDASSAEHLDSAYAHLKWALKAPHASPALRAATLNNAGIYYARTNNPQAALRCLERVGRQGGVVVEDDVSVHVTLNMTTVLADLGRHAEALEKAQEAVRTRPVPSGRASQRTRHCSRRRTTTSPFSRSVWATRGPRPLYRAAVLQARRAQVEAGRVR